MKKHLLLAAFLALSFATFLALSFATAESANTAQYINTVPDAQGNLVIDTAGITSQASFVNYAANGSVIQLIVVRASNGEIRTAFNTCQSCNPSPRAFFVQKGSRFVCQNCGNAFATNQIGLQKGGCNPAPVMQKQMDGNKLIIPANYLAQYAPNFKNWAGATK